MSENSWRSPATLIAIAGLCVSLVGNAIQYVSASNDAEMASRELTIKEKQWDGERKKLALEIEDLRKKIEIRSEEREKYLAELTQVNENISVKEDKIFENEIELKLLKSKHDGFVRNGKTIEAEYALKNIDLQMNNIEEGKAQRDQLIARRKEIETRLAELN